MRTGLRPAVTAVCAAALALAPTPGALAAGTCGPGVAGDLNGDGTGDAVIGQPGYLGGAGAIGVIYGSGGLLSATQPRQNRMVTQANTGVPGDLRARNFFGQSVLTADFDGDGCDDVAVGSYGESRYHGAVTVLFGSTGGLQSKGALRFVPGAGGVPASVGDAEFGFALAAGDFDGDGRTDLAVGAEGDGVKAGGRRRGAVYVFRNGPAGLGTGGIGRLSADSTGVPEVAEDGDYFGSSLAAGDFDGNGADDLVVGVPGEDGNAGALVVLPGTPGRPLRTAPVVELTQDSPGVPGAAERSDVFGTRLAAGDVTGDGRDDLVVGASGEDDGAGSVTLLKGGPAGLTGAGSELWTKSSPGVDGIAEEDQTFGYSLAVGRFDTDPYADVAIGASDTVGGHANAGGVTFLRGSAAGLSTAGNGGRLITQRNVAGTATAQVRFGSTLAALSMPGAPQTLLVGVPGWRANADKPRSGLVWELPSNRSGPVAGEARDWFPGAHDGDGRIAGTPTKDLVFGASLG